MGTTAQDEGDALDCRRGIILWWRSGGLCSGRQQALTPASVQILIEFGKQLITPSPWVAFDMKNPKPETWFVIILFIICVAALIAGRLSSP